MSDVDRLLKRARRFSLMAQLLETYDSKSERLEFIKMFRDRGCISDLSADLLVEEYGLERAE